MKFPKQPGQFVVAIEGIDSIGKGTASRNLVSQANRLGFTSASYVEVPIRDEQTHTQIYEWLNNGLAKKHPATFQALQVANRLIWQNRVFPTIINDLIVLDRFNASSYAYGRAAGLQDEELQVLLDLVYKPDATIILDGNPFHRDQEKDDYEKDDVFQARVRQYYREWADENGAICIDANQSTQAVTKQIIDALRPLVAEAK